MEKVIVRTTIFGLAIYMSIVFYFAWNGILVTFDGYVVLLDYCLYRLACDEGRYHCKYARAIPINLMFTDTIACLDDTFNIMPTAEIYLFIVSTTWIISIALTVYLGIRHFIKVRRIKKQKIWAIFSDECSETEISSAINSLEKVNSEYVRPTDVLNCDESMRVLNFSNNRVGFKRLMDAKGIEQVIFKNRKIGYRKSEILALKSELEAEQKAKKAKEKPYKQNKAVNKKPRLSNMEKMY